MTALERLIADYDSIDTEYVSPSAALIAAARAEQAELVEACRESLPWVATAMAHRRDKRPEFDAHPDAVKNHEAALGMLQAVLAKHASPAP